MTTRPRLRKFVLIAHVVSSVGWLGATAAFLSLAVAAVSTRDGQLTYAAYLGMELIGRFVLVPLSLASLITGAALALGTKWGLIRHYWVLTKVLIGVVAAIALSLYVQTLASLAALAGRKAWSSDDVSKLTSASPLIHAAVALSVLLAAVALSVYKPRGMTWYGRRKHHERRVASRGRRSTD